MNILPLNERMQIAGKLAQHRILSHPGLGHPDARDSLANYVASFCDISVDQAHTAIDSVWPQEMPKEAQP